MTFVLIYPMVSKWGFGSYDNVCFLICFISLLKLCLYAEFRLKSFLSLYNKELRMKIKCLVSWYTNEVRNLKYSVVPSLDWKEVK